MCSSDLIGAPPLAKLDQVPPDTIFVFEFSSHQLAELSCSPHIAVLLNIVPEHLDYYSDFRQYASAKENITRSIDPATGKPFVDTGMRSFNPAVNPASGVASVLPAVRTDNLSVQQAGNTVQAAQGGIMHAAKGTYLRGSTDGMADKLDTSIDGVQPAKLSHGNLLSPQMSFPIWAMVILMLALRSCTK